MEYTLQGTTLFVPHAGGFDPNATLYCGQCFRWQRQPNGVHRGVVHGAVRLLRQQGEGLILWPCEKQEVEYFLHYLALDDDYASILTVLRRNPRLRLCVNASPGIRVLHQDFFETLLTFIISQNNNIPRIQAIVERLCEGFGDPLENGAHAFPTPQALAGLNEQDLAFLRAGWRADYLLHAAQAVASGRVSEEKLADLSTESARNLLMTIRGVGPKVADCVLLFGLERSEALPMDVWMKRAMKQHFPKGMPRYLVPYAGIAQQFLFDYPRRLSLPQDN